MVDNEDSLPSSSDEENNDNIYQCDVCEDDIVFDVSSSISQGFVCDVCNCDVCDECSSTCKKCKDTFCTKHKRKCDVCGIENVCPCCINVQCGICGEDVCDKCMATRTNYEQKVCTQCVPLCGECCHRIKDGTLRPDKAPFFSGNNIQNIHKCGECMITCDRCSTILPVLKMNRCVGCKDYLCDYCSSVNFTKTEQQLKKCDCMQNDIDEDEEGNLKSLCDNCLVKCKKCLQEKCIQNCIDYTSGGICKSCRESSSNSNQTTTEVDKKRKRDQSLVEDYSKNKQLIVGRDIVRFI